MNTLMGRLSQYSSIVPCPRSLILAPTDPSESCAVASARIAPPPLSISSSPRAAHFTCSPERVRASWMRAKEAMQDSLLRRVISSASSAERIASVLLMRSPAGDHCVAHTANQSSGLRTRPSTSLGLSRAGTLGSTPDILFCLVTLSHTDPWMLKAARSPPHAFLFQILSADRASDVTSRKRVSRVGRPGRHARSTDPSGSTNLRRTEKSWTPGLSET
mmetsp:Transcript_18788/g.45240  ORF Transcript_18788/g.45240 Transcript_18788/m.45240 type:complete len:218 (-) Transcript_18788:1586-2239(-)